MTSALLLLFIFVPAAVDPPRAVTVAVTSDRGLCGGLNSNITKYTKALMHMYKGGEQIAGAFPRFGIWGRGGGCRMAMGLHKPIAVR